MIAEPDTAAQPLLGPVEEVAGEIGGARREADSGVEEIGLLKGCRIPLQLRAGGSLEPKPLAGATKRGAGATKGMEKK